jgi:branched-chain amino acid transport system substrate-binding protein
VLGERAPTECRRSIPLSDGRFTEVIDRIRDVAPDAVLRMGACADAAAFVQRLRGEGITSSFVSAQGLVDAQFPKRARDYAKDDVLSCPCSPDPDWFVAGYRAKFGRTPGAYSAEGYDLARIMFNGIDAGMLVRPEMLDWMKHYDGQGVARRYQWTETGELTQPTVWIYRVQ